jgi:hypothetical protein
VNINLYVDDVRPCPDGWVVARQVMQAQWCLSRQDVQPVDQCSLDHDMGACVKCQAKSETELNWCPHVLDGTKLVRWMVETGHWPQQKPTVHSMNPAGRTRMQGLIDQFFGDPAHGPMF